MEEYQIEIKKKKIKTSSVRIKNNKIIFTISTFLNKKTEEATLQKFQKWAERKIKTLNTKRIYNNEYKDGGIIQTHNCNYTILIKHNNKTSSYKVDKNKNIIIKQNYLKLQTKK